MEFTDELKNLLIDIAKQLKGSDRHRCMARTVKALGTGGASQGRTRIRLELQDGMQRDATRVENGIKCPEAANEQKNTCPTCWWI